MSLPAPLPYNFHDAVIVSSVYHDNTWTLRLLLYEIFYPGRQEIYLVFEGVHNTEMVLRFHGLLNAGALEPGWIGTRINRLNYDTKKNSSATQLFIYLDADHTGHLVVSCQRLLARPALPGY